MKKIFVIMNVIAMLIGGITSVSAESKCPHVHDNKCGYDEKTGTGCTHDCERDGHPECDPRLRMGCMFCKD